MTASAPPKTRPTRDYLVPIKGTIKRKKFIVVDLESKHNDTQDAGFTRPFLVGAYDPAAHEYLEWRDEPHLKERFWAARHYSPGGCVDKFLNFVLTPRFSGQRIYAHNGGNFDHLFWLRWLRIHDDEFGFEIVPVQSSIQILRAWRLPEHPDDPVREQWEFADSLKLLPMSLEKACQTFGLDGKVSHDLNMHEDDAAWSTYLRRDCLALAEVLARTHELVENTLGGEIGITAPATSMKLYRRKYLGQGSAPRKVPRYQHWDNCTMKASCPGCAHEWIRRGYYGGRTEPFRMHGKGLHYYDINSSYVAAMREFMPVDGRMVEQGKIDWNFFSSHAGFAECTVRIPADCKIPPLPHRAKKTGKLLFPAGTFHGVWSLEELKLLEDPLVRGEILSVDKCVWFRRQPLFVEMVQELWKLRDKSLPGYDEGLSALAKLMGNSLYGKFGMSRDKTLIAMADPRSPEKCFLCQKSVPRDQGLCSDCEGSKSATGDSECDVWYQRKQVDASYIIPHIAAHITALARVRLWRFMKMAVEAGGDVYYTDTDSILTDAVLPSSSALGALKDEYPGVTLEGVFVQPKVYLIAAEDGSWDAPKVTMKGFPKAQRTAENLERLRKGETIEWSQLEKVRSLARLGFNRSPRMRDVKKSFQTVYDKRVLNADSVSTRAVVLDEDMDRVLDLAAEE